MKISNKRLREKYWPQQKKNFPNSTLFGICTSSRPHIKRTNFPICTEKSSSVIEKKYIYLSIYIYPFCSHQTVSIEMHKNKKQQELPTCNFVLLLSKASMMLMTCLCDFIQIYTTVPQVFPAPTFILPYHVCRIDNNFQNSVGFGVFVGLFGVLGFVTVVCAGVFPQASMPRISKQATFGWNKDFLISWKTASTKCLHHRL